MVGTLSAQPPKSRVQNSRTAAAKKASGTAAGTDRASLMFPRLLMCPKTPVGGATSTAPST